MRVAKRKVVDWQFCHLEDNPLKRTNTLRVPIVGQDLSKGHAGCSLFFFR